MQEESLAPRMHRTPDLGKSIVSAFADGKWHDIAVITKKYSAPQEDVRAVLENIRSHNTFNCKAEKKEFAKTFHYRIFPQERQVSTVELVEKLSEPLAMLKETGRGKYGHDVTPDCCLLDSQDSGASQ
jgi:hypothetical protein